jgi:hypothetical protein
MSFEFFVAKRYFTSRHRQGFLSLLGAISIGVVLLSTASLLLVMSVMNGFETEVRDRIIGTMAHIMVASRFAGGIQDWSDLQKQIQDVHGVVATSPVVIAKSAIASKYETDGVVVRGVIPKDEKNVSDISDYLITHDLSFATPDTNYVGVWLGIDLANRLNVTLDDRVRLYSLKDVGSGLTGLAPKVMPCMVAGIVETGMSTYDDNFVYMPLDKAQELFDLGNAVTTIEVKTDDFYSAWKTAGRIAEAVGLKYSATDWMDDVSGVDVVRPGGGDKYRGAPDYGRFGQADRYRHFDGGRTIQESHQKDFRLPGAYNRNGGRYSWHNNRGDPRLGSEAIPHYLPAQRYLFHIVTADRHKAARYRPHIGHRGAYRFAIFNLSGLAGLQT